MTTRQQAWIDAAHAGLGQLTRLDGDRLRVIDLLKIGEAVHVHQYLTQRGFSAMAKSRKYTNGEFCKSLYRVPTDEYLETRTIERRAFYIQTCGRTPQEMGDAVLA